MENKTTQLAKLLDDDSFVRWIKGEASSEEQKTWNRWLESDATHKELAAQARALYSLPFSQTEVNDASRQKGKLREELGRNKKIKKLHTLHTRTRSKKRRWTSWAVAASIALLIGIVSWLTPWQREKPVPINYTTVHTKYGVKNSLHLADGSVIVLNANSTLQYDPKSIATKDTRITLEGEAYFSIKHNPDRTLSVITKDGVIKDIGTVFDVNTRNHKTEVALAEGKINVTKKKIQPDAPGKSYAAHPGELVTFSLSQKDIAVRNVNTDVYTSWVHNQLTFDKTPLHEIANRIEATYGVDISVKDPALLNRTISGSVGSSNLSILLKGLSQTLGVQIMRQDGKITIAQK